MSYIKKNGKMISIGTKIAVGRRSGASAPVIVSAVIENAAPADVVLTFDKTVTGVVAADFTLAGKTISNCVIAGSVVTLTVSVAYVYGDVVTVSYLKDAGNVDSFTGQSVTNNIAAEAELTTYITGLTTELSIGYRREVNEFIKALKIDYSISSLDEVFDAIYILASETAESSLKNLVKNATHATVATTTTTKPMFSRYIGPNFNGLNNYINTNFNISTDGVRYSKDSAAIAIYPLGHRSGNCNMGVNSGGNGFTVIYGQTGGNAYFNNNAAVNLSAGTQALNGLLINSRTANNRVDYYTEGISRANSNQVSQDLVNGKIAIAATLNGVSPLALQEDQYSIAYISRGLNSNECADLNTITENFLDSNKKLERQMVLEKGGTYNGWKADAIAAPGVCWDGTRFVLTVSLWSIEESAWASAFFTSSDMINWTYINNSLLTPTGLPTLLGNGKVVWWDNKYWFTFNYPDACYIWTSTDLLTWTKNFDPFTSAAYDPELSINPTTGKLELWYRNGAYCWMWNTSDGVNWTEVGNMNAHAAFNYGSNYGAFAVFYIGSVRYMAVDGSYVLGDRRIRMLHSVNQDTTWLNDGLILQPNSNSWESQQVFDASIIVADLNDGRGNIPRVLYCGSDIIAGVDATNSSLGLYHLKLDSYA